MKAMSNGKYVPPHRRRPRDDHFKTPSRNKVITSRNNDKSHRVLARAIPKAYCINLASRTDKWKRFQRNASNVSLDFLESICKFHAINGAEVDEAESDDIQIQWDSTTNAKYSPKEAACIRTMLPGEIGCAFSHIALWRMLAASDDSHWLILEDDCGFVSSRGGQDRFSVAFERAWEEVPSDWGIFYLGFSDRGTRTYIKQCNVDTATRRRDRLDPDIEIFRPEYGYHTHAYMITKAAATCLLENLPVSGPIDVWLADNQWFGVPTYCAVIANEGWRREDGSYEGSQLVYQSRGKNFTSDVSPFKR